jgi:hypothetical protein
MLRGVRKRDWSPERPDRELLTEHLFYEVQMTFFLAGRLAAPVSSRVDVSLRNAQIEAFTVHLGQLVEFFWEERRRRGNERVPFAADYFRDGEWARLRPARPVILERASAAGIARLGYYHAWAPPADRVWDLVSQAFALAPVVKRFADKVDQTQFTPGYVGGMKICAEMFEGARGARPPLAA